MVVVPSVQVRKCGCSAVQVRKCGCSAIMLSYVRTLYVALIPNINFAYQNTLSW